MPFNGLSEMIGWAIAIVVAIFAVLLIVYFFKAGLSFGRAIEDLMEFFGLR